MTSAQDRIQKSRPRGKTGGILQSFQVLAAKIDLAKNETKQATTKESQTNPPPRRKEKKKKNEKPTHPSTPDPSSKGCCSWKPALNDRQKWEARTIVLRQLMLNSRTQTLSELIGISHFS